MGGVRKFVKDVFGGSTDEGGQVPGQDLPTIGGDVDVTPDVTGDSIVGQDEPTQDLAVPDIIDIPDVTIESAIGGQLDNPGSLFTPEEEEGKLKSINKKRMGTRGLQIPLVSDTSTTTTAAEGGIQI